jgi:hypothetical protein
MEKSIINFENKTTQTEKIYSNEDYENSLITDKER